MCSVMAMEECQSCPTTASSSSATTALQLPKCDLLASYGSLCAIMPDMTNCQTQQQTCSSLSTLPGLKALCTGTPSGSGSSPVTIGGSGSSDDDSQQLPPIMRMYLHTGIVDYVLFKGFVPRTNTQYFGACVFTATVAIVMMAIENMRKRMQQAFRDRVNVMKAVRRAALKAKKESNAASALASSSSASTATQIKSDPELKAVVISTDAPSTCCGGDPIPTAAAEPPTPTSSSTSQKSSTSTLTPITHLQTRTKAWYRSYRFDLYREQHHILRSLLRTLEVFLAYVLMLIVMQFNVGLISAALIGVLVGNFVFGRDDEEVGGVAEGDCCM
ncbi:hypothetical protein HDU97_004694 [Phlyctochytrium planicorne]|nr:hypothetical protein HDU97_004694 [Phlyctochytrium planicorne]